MAAAYAARASRRRAYSDRARPVIRGRRPCATLSPVGSQDPRFLSAGEVAQFDALGVVVRRGALSPAEVDAALREMESVCAEVVGHAPGDGDVVWESPFVERSPMLADLVADDRIFQAVCDLLGEDVLWEGSEGMWGFDDLADHHWHADGGWLREQIEPYRLKVMLYLDPLRRDTGALRIIPGSHRALLHESLLPFHEETGAGGDRRYFGSAAKTFPRMRSRPIPGTWCSSTTGCATPSTARSIRGGRSSQVRAHARQRPAPGRVARRTAGARRQRVAGPARQRAHPRADRAVARLRRHGGPGHLSDQVN